MVAVTYYCPHCGALAELDRDAYLADRSVTPYPFEGWEYATPTGNYEEADGVWFICGDSTMREQSGCGEPFYLRFVWFEEEREIDPEPPTEYVEIGTAVGLQGPPGPGK